VDLSRARIAPKPLTSPNRAKGHFGRDAFRYIVEDNEYECPAGERLVWYMNTQDKGRTVQLYWTSKCRHCAIKSQCTSGVHRKMTRWEHEAVLERAQARLDRNPQMMHYLQFNLGSPNRDSLIVASPVCSLSHNHHRHRHRHNHRHRNNHQQGHRGCLEVHQAARKSPRWVATKATELPQTVV
jgi:hypothetical protein